MNELGHTNFAAVRSNDTNGSKTIDELVIESHRGAHVFRKTFQNRLKWGNVDMADRQKLMRHSDNKTTIDSYTYSDTTRLRNVLDGLESITSSFNSDC